MPSFPKPLPQLAVAHLSRLLGNDFHQNPVHLLTHSYDATQKILPPQAVAMPTSLNQMKKILDIALGYQIPLIPRGAGSGFSGGALAPCGGLVLVLDRLDEFTIEPASKTATAAPGVINARLDKAARKFGLFYPPDPASREFCTLGGNVAENAGGPHCLKYGVTRDYVHALQAWSPGIGYFKASRSYQPNFLDILIGSEGTLAIFLEIQVLLRTEPTHKVSLAAAFATPAQACSAVQSLLMTDLAPSRLELLDQRCIRAVEDYAHLGLPVTAGAMLMVELDGFYDLGNKAQKARDVLNESCATTVSMALSSVEQQALWAAREAISPALARIAPWKLNEDVALAPSKLPLLMIVVDELSKRFNLVIPCFGHAGDGNLHINFMYDDNITGMMERVEAAAEELLGAVIHLGGTISGEHGIGLAKAKFLELERGKEYMQTMSTVKRFFDPPNILNPGKIGL